MRSLARRAWPAFLLLLPALACATESGPGEDAVIPCFQVRDADPAAAIALAERALAMDGLGNETTIKLEACVSRAATHLGKIERADEAIERVVAGLEQEDFPPEFLLRALSNTGAALHTMGRYHAALDHYVRAFEAARLSESELAQAAMLSNVGSIHSEALGAYQEAETYFARAEALDLRMDRLNPYLHLGRGENRMRGGDLAAAVVHFAEAERQAVELRLHVLELRARSLRIASQAGLRGRYSDDVVSRLEDIATRQTGSGDLPGSAVTLAMLSDVVLRAGDPGHALALAERARHLLPEGAYPVERSQVLTRMLAALRAQHRWEEALDISETLRELGASTLHRDGMHGLATLQAKLQDRQSARELDQLREARRIEALELRHASRIRNASIGALLVLTGLAGCFIWYQRRVTRRLRRLSSIDGLTGLLNRRTASGRLEARPAPSPDEAGRGVLFLIDIDHFKALNDRHGHAAGDSVLKAVAQQLRASSRPDDVVARWGGEEFLVGCRCLDLSAATAMAERLRTAVAGVALPDIDPGRQLSVSIGFACHPFLPARQGPDDWEEALAVADRALYAAKRGGRDGWVGLWGDAGCTASVDSILADPAHHIATGAVHARSSRLPLVWQPMAETSPTLDRQLA